MNRRHCVGLCCTLAACVPSVELDPHPAFLPVVDHPALPRVLLIGDSISLGYTLPVRRLLKDLANVHRIPQNGESSARGLVKLDAWLGRQRWDVIHFNWGLHDLKLVRGSAPEAQAMPQVSLVAYRSNLSQLVMRLKRTGAKLIFANTTPVPIGAEGRAPGAERLYNAVAAHVMLVAGVQVNDLHAYCSPHLARWQLKADVHFNTIGNAALAEKVASEVSIMLSPPG